MVDIVLAVVFVCICLAVPAAVIAGWIRWAKRRGSPTRLSLLSLIAFGLATCSALVAFASFVAHAIGGLPLYHPAVMWMARGSMLFALGGVVIGVVGCWRRHPLRWYAPICAVGIVMFWLLFAATGALLIPSYRSSPPKDIVIIRVYRDWNSDFRRELDYKFYTFTDQQHRISSGKRIYVATMEPFNYKQELGGKVARIQPQIVVLNAPADASLIRGMDFDLQKARNVCGRGKNCPAFIPRWVSGEDFEAARTLLDAITSQ